MELKKICLVMVFGILSIKSSIAQTSVEKCNAEPVLNLLIKAFEKNNIRFTPELAQLKSLNNTPNYFEQKTKIDAEIKNITDAFVCRNFSTALSAESPNGIRKIILTPKNEDVNFTKTMAASKGYLLMNNGLSSLCFAAYYFQPFNNDSSPLANLGYIKYNIELFGAASIVSACR